jgi:hypothetical protein
MLGLEMLDVAIGLIFVYLLLSLVCSAVNELIELKLKHRGANLHEGIKELLGDDGPVEQLYRHPLVFGLFKGEYDSSSKNLPSYIPARNFALALMDIVSQGNELNYSGARGATAAKTSPSLARDEIESFRGVVAGLENQTLREALIPLVDAAGNSMSGARENIEAWFNSSMDRISGWYKRRTQTIILFLGLVITIAVNADTVTIVNSLSQDAALRGALVATAGEYAKTQPQENTAAEDRVTKTIDQIKALGLPVGWDRNDVRTIPGNFGGWLLKVFGWLLTAAAITLGAPFWFDLLNKFMVIRSTVKPHEKSQEEGSEDRQVPAGQRQPTGTAVTVTSNSSGSDGAASLAALGSFQPNEWAQGDPQEGIV